MLRGLRECNLRLETINETSQRSGDETREAAIGHALNLISSNSKGHEIPRGQFHPCSCEQSKSLE